MFLIDENVSELEVLRLRKAGVRVRLIGDDIADIGTTDENLIPVLRRLKQPVLFTQDEDFFQFRWLHADYTLVWLDTRPGEVAELVRRFLRHPDFDTQGRRMGTVVRVTASGIQYWRKGNRRLLRTAWPMTSPSHPRKGVLAHAEIWLARWLRILFREKADGRAALPVHCHDSAS